jgi:hypothetical protein
MKNEVFWDLEPCEFIKKHRFGGACRLHVQGRRNNASEKSARRIFLHYLHKFRDANDQQFLQSRQFLLAVRDSTQSLLTQLKIAHSGSPETVAMSTLPVEPHNFRMNMFIS